MFLELSKKGNNSVGLYVAGILIVMFFYFLGQLPMGLVQYYKISTDSSIGTDALAQFEKTMDFGIFGLHKNTGLFLLILIFVFALFGLLIVLKMHKKKLKDLITPHKSINLNKILFGFGFWFLLSIGFEFFMYIIAPDNYIFRFHPGSFIVLLIICLTLLPIQTSFEELFFRGYLIQGIAFFSKNKWLPLLVTSILFGLIHGMNPEVEKFGFWTMQMYYITAGLFLGIITLLDDSLELALGVHAATNFYGATMVTYEGSVLQTDTLAATKVIDPLAMLGIFLVAAVIFVYVCSKKYNWPSLKSLLNPLEESESDELKMTTVTYNDETI